MNDLPNTTFRAIAENGTKIIAGTNLGAIYLSTNNGSNWTIINKDHTIFQIYSLTFDDTNIFVGSYGEGVSLSTDTGLTWVQINDGLKNNYVTPLAICGTNIFAGIWGAAVWKRPLSELVGAAKEENNLPQNYKLSQNFPNPFNPNTIINFSLPKATHITLSIYNSLGQEVSKLISKDMNPGNYTTEWNASGFTSGVYYYRIVAVDFVQTKKLILLK